MADEVDVQRLAATYEDFGRRWAHDTSPAYEEITVGIADDRELLGLIAALPPAKRQPNLVLASARWEGALLGSYPAWREWTVTHWDQVVATALARATQTNEVSRCATLLPVLSRIDGPVALLEVGTAAGLCLYPDRYGYDYAAPSGTRTLDPVDGRLRSSEDVADVGESARNPPTSHRSSDAEGSSDADAVRLACRIDDDAAVPIRMPEVVWRRGIDLRPIDVSDPDAVAWLENLIWPGPDHDARVSRLRGAVEIATADPPHIVSGDLLETLTDVAATSPADATLVLFHSAVLLYLDAHERRRFADLVADLGQQIDRRVVWLSNETLGTLPEIDARVPAGVETAQRFVQTVDGVPIALAGQHGAVYETALFR